MKHIQIASLLVAGFFSLSSNAETYTVSDIPAYQSAVAKLVPGDRIVLKNGVWNDFEILLEGKGTAEKPIRLEAETKGKVILSGNSNLRLAGEHLIVAGLVFKNGIHTDQLSHIIRQKQIRGSQQFTSHRDSD